ncbi:hypothetical protein PVAP13_1NG316700 [Panicum virgatum]|uniref:Uncharacterized protein n=1 Tax=Panicum virgatum TaxID=38727 RepID=A0A8T0WX36_PANVG|nr:hypothetical protein PVAP13_1NG316700 [Panicum virgatum]
MRPQSGERSAQSWWIWDGVVLFNFSVSNSDTSGVATVMGIRIAPPEGQAYFHHPTVWLSDNSIILDFICKILVMIPMLLVAMILYMATPTPLEKLGVSLAMLERLRSSRGPRLKLRLGLARVFMAAKSELSQYLAQAGKLILLMMVKIRFALLRMLSLEFMRGLLLMRVLGMKTVKKLGTLAFLRLQSSNLHIMVRRLFQIELWR